MLIKSNNTGLGDIGGKEHFLKAKRRFKLHALSVLAALVIAAFVAGCGSSETIGGG